MVTQVVTYIRTAPTPLRSLFIPYKFLVRMMMKFRITQEKEREKEEDYYTDNGGFPLSLKFDIQDNE